MRYQALCKPVADFLLCSQASNALCESKYQIYGASFVLLSRYSARETCRASKAWLATVHVERTALPTVSQPRLPLPLPPQPHIPFAVNCPDEWGETVLYVVGPLAGATYSDMCTSQDPAFALWTRMTLMAHHDLLHQRRLSFSDLSDAALRDFGLYVSHCYDTWNEGSKWKYGNVWRSSKPGWRYCDSTLHRYVTLGEEEANEHGTLVRIIRVPLSRITVDA